MVGEPSEAAKHHVLIARQPFARLQGGTPFALKHRDVVEHFGGRFSDGNFFAAIMAVPNALSPPHPMQPRLMACKKRAGAGSDSRL